MVFINPTLALVGLACIALPILIHILMRRRRRPVDFGAMRFLIEAYRRQRRRMNLEQILLLASRCLLVALLALALGRPLFGAKRGLLGTPARTVYIVIDNSLSSAAGDALEQTKARALALLGTLDSARGDRVALFAAAGPAETLVSPPSGDLSAVGELIRAISVTDSKADWPGAFARVRDDLKRTLEQEPGASATVGVFSDFRAGSAEVASELPSLGVPDDRLTLLASPPAGDAIDNIALASLEPSRGVMLAGAGDGLTASLRVTLKRSGSAQAATGKVILRAGDSGASPGGSDAGQRNAPRAEATYTFAPGATTTSVLANLDLPAGAVKGRVLVTASIDRDALERDNTYSRTLDLRERLRILLLASPSDRSGIQSYKAGDWLALALAPDAQAALLKRKGEQLAVETIDPARPLAGVTLSDADAVLIANPEALPAASWPLIKQASQQGAFVMVFAPAGVQTHTWTDAFIQNLAPGWNVSPEAKDYTPATTLTPGPSTILEAIAGELPELLRPVHVMRSLPTTAPGAGVVLALGDGSPGVLATGREGGSAGALVFWAIAPDLAWTDLPARPLMVPLMQELVRQGVGLSGSPRVALAGQAPALPLGAAELAPTSGAPISIEPGGRLSRPIRTAGTYTIRAKGGTTLGQISFNPDTRASDLTPSAQPALERWLGGLGGRLAWISDKAEAAGGNARPANDESSPLSFALLAGALLLALAELIMARFFSHAEAASERAA
ncbi:MAG: VWA domain-containing protein [Tepidisphaera sp.]|nr:VWA domain-containing protein [Tepidisphaera sp.]